MRPRQGRDARRTGARSTRARSRSSARAWTQAIAQDRRAALARGSRDDRSIPSPLHPGRRRAAFQSTGRPPQSHYPTYRELLLATDALGHGAQLPGRPRSRFSSSRSLQERDLVIPVVGDLSGSRALAAIGSRLRQKGQRLSAFYASNVEFYLFGDGRFERFVTNLGGMPRADNGVVIRSVFGRFSGYGGGSSSASATARRPRARLRRRPVPQLRRPHRPLAARPHPTLTLF